MTVLLTQFVEPGDQDDISLAWGRMMSSIQGAPETVIIPPGEYETSQPLDVSAPVLVIAWGVSLKARHSAAVRVTSPRATIVGLEVLGGGRLNNQSHGFDIRARARLVWCTARNFGLDGFSLVGDVNVQPPTSVSISLLVGCESTGHGGRGFVAQAGDANAILFLGCTSSDCLGEFAGRQPGERRVGGFHDLSFLGSYFLGCHGGVHDKDAPAPERALGYCATKPASRSVIAACYQEMSNEMLVQNDNVVAWTVGPVSSESNGGVFRGGSILGKFSFESILGAVKPRLIFAPNKIDGYLAEVRSALDNHAFALVRDTTGAGAGYWTIKQRNTDAGDVIRLLADAKANLPPELWFPLGIFVGPARKKIDDAWVTQLELRLAAIEARLTTLEST